LDYRILFTERALGDLAEIIGYIAHDDEAAASRFGTALLDQIDLLARFPGMGGVVRERSHVRKLVHAPVLVYYQVDDDRRVVEILHLRHGSRKEATK
jgi:plasmid stabilization system protein ParE